MTIEGLEHLEKDGWELVRVGRIDFGEYFVNSSGVATQWDATRSTCENFLIIRKKPKQYRPFANAAEFAPHRDRWTMHPNEPDKRFRAGDYDNDGVWGISGKFYDYIHLFESGTLFDDGSPFGVEVQS